MHARTVLGLSAALLVALVLSSTAASVTALLSARSPEALVGPGYVDSFLLSCTTSPTLIEASCGQISYSAQVDDAAGGDVYFGDSSVTSSTGHAVGPGEFNSGNVRREWCRAVTSAKDIRVRALCASAPSGAELAADDRR